MAGAVERTKRGGRGVNRRRGPRWCMDQAREKFCACEPTTDRPRATCFQRTTSRDSLVPLPWRIQKHPRQTLRMQQIRSVWKVYGLRQLARYSETGG